MEAEEDAKSRARAWLEMGGHSDELIDRLFTLFVDAVRPRESILVSHTTLHTTLHIEREYKALRQSPARGLARGRHCRFGRKWQQGQQD